MKKHFCDDVIEQILRLLPVKSLLRFKSVSKTWHDLISDSRFKQLHLNHASYNYNGGRICFLKPEKREEEAQVGQVALFVNLASVNSDVTEVELDLASSSTFGLPHRRVNVYGSCNGLLFIAVGEDTFLWNPSTREHVMLSRPNDTEFARPTNFISGLGYNPSRDEYKALIIYYLSKHDYDSDVESRILMYNSKVGYWKELDLDFSYDAALIFSYQGIVVNGFPHWVVYDYGDTSCSRFILYFDTVDEEFKRVPTPLFWSDSYKHSCKITILGRCLSVVHDNYVDQQPENTTLDVWVMNEYGVVDSWTKLFVLPNADSALLSLLPGNFIPLGFANNGDEIAVEVAKKNILTYNLDTKEITSVVIDMSIYSSYDLR